MGKINKTLDLVITIVQPGRPLGGRRTFEGVATEYGIVLDPSDRQVLAGLPVIQEEARDDVSEVAIAMEAKACMTEHSKSLPRLHAEILATGYLARQAAKRCVSVSYSIINGAPSFVTSEKKVNRHKQPDDAARVINMLETALPLANEAPSAGYDAIGATVLHCANDGSPVTLPADLAPPTTSHVRYERMIVGVCSEFRNRFKL